MSVDWSLTYATIGPDAQAISQRSFLHLLERGAAYQLEAPTLWDVDFQTAVAQAELEDRERQGAMHHVRFQPGPTERAGADRDDASGADPGLCRAARSPRRRAPAALVGRTVLTAVRHALPVMTHPLVERDKGSGLVMGCTFGDLTDVIWWRELWLPRPAGARHRRPAGGSAMGRAGWETTT